MVDACDVMNNDIIIHVIQGSESFIRLQCTALHETRVGVVGVINPPRTDMKTHVAHVTAQMA
jgi:hypothetical protein